ncbi:MAG: type III-A CRISPR-associated protein Csm2 [Deltaproteobacteria bacterium]|nr:type III-A CRISPR-associated protein Csm2 [Deltaproteobacteria bacterium]
MEKIIFWKDRDKQLVDPELFSKIAENLAKKIAEDSINFRNSNKRTQIRKFYDEIVRLAMLSKSRPNEWEQLLPMVHMITAKAAYANGRKKLISDNFLQFLRDSIEQIKKPEDLNIFSNFFEAFMGFYRLHGPKN